MSPRRRGRGRGRGGAAAAAPDPVSSAYGSPIEGEPLAGGTDPVGAAPHPARPARLPRPAQPSRGPAERGNSGSLRAESSGSRRPSRPVVQSPAAQPDRDAVAADGEEPAEQKSSCTLAQMRRFIKSRPYVPVHELRRRFEIEGIEDEVSPMSTGQGTLYVGLPELQAGYLGELVKAGEVGCELLLDPTSPGVIGVFPMRPVARQ